MRKLILGVLLVLATSSVYAQNQNGQGQNQNGQGQNQNGKASEIDLANVMAAIGLVGGTALIIRARRKERVNANNV
jgi:hypothetical protein